LKTVIGIKLSGLEKKRMNRNGVFFARVPKKRCRTLPAEGLGVFPQTEKSPKIGGFRGLNTAFLVLCLGEFAH
jgi:hypothetical protein